MSSKLLLCVALAVPSTLAASGQAKPGERDIVATAEAAGTFQTLIAAVRAAGLVDVLRSEGPFTVLAPTDAAFAALPEGLIAALLRPEAREQLVAILKRHVVAGRLSAADILSAGSAATLAGDRLTVSLEDGQLTIGGAKVVSNDIDTANGVIHAIDRVLLPPRPAMAPTPSSAQLIELAIERGVPLFNAGQTAACAAIYEVTATSLLAHSDPVLPEAVRSQLAQALRTDADAGERAWSLRRAVDAAYLALDPSAREAGSSQVMTVEHFDDPGSGAAWRLVNDTVMGGVSDSEFKTDGRGTATFSGDVSLENNGGFASAWRLVDARAFSGYAGVELRVRGDGKTYQLGANLRAQTSGDLYQTEFATKAGEWTEVRVPFAELERSIMGYRPPNAAPIIPASIRQIGVTIAGKQQDGPFQLEIDWIRAYRAD